MKPSGGDRGVRVLGVGAYTPVGVTALSSAAAVRAGIAGLAEHPHAVDASGEPIVVTRVPTLDLEVQGANRLIQLALPAALEALPRVEITRCLPRELPVIVGLPDPRAGLPPKLEDEFTDGMSRALTDRLHAPHVSTITGGHAAGLMAVERGFNAIRTGACDICLAGGVDSYLHPDTLAWLELEEQLHSSTVSWGFCPGEAAGFCLLASERAVEELGLVGQARLIGCATAHEPNGIKTGAICLGEGLTAALDGVLSNVVFAYNKVNQIICDMNGEPYRGDEFGFAFIRTSRYFDDTADCLTPADCWGDVGAASGPLFIVLAVIAARKDYALGDYTVVYTSGENGNRTAALLATHLET